MLQGKRTRRIIAATLLSVMLTNTLAPGVSYALTSGPTSPEATSFEPIDTTDMVNLQSGDLSYTLPLLEVPGPDGGYPLSLSYHAGIQPNEDASWVGLGWTLNPGAINRSVNGYPDDWYSPQQSRRDYWVGGETRSYEVGVSIGIANSPATVSFGLSFSQDTYRGFGVGYYTGIGSGLSLSKNDKVGLNASVRVGVSPYGDPYMSGGVGIGVGLTGGKDGGLNASLGIGFSTNFESLSAGVSGGIGYSMKSAGHEESIGGSLLGASIGTGGGKPSFEVGGLTASVSNSNAGNIQTSSTSFGIDIPVWYGVNLSLGYSKTRYWSDETVTITTHGSIYGSGWGESGDQAYDTYALLENPNDKNIVDYPDPSIVQGGAYPDFDVYSVNAQGLGGNMRPYLFQGEVMRQNIKSGSTPKVTYYSPAVTNSYPRFRFANDFSNSYRQNYPGYANPDLNLRFVEPPFDANPVYGNNDGNYGMVYNDGGYTLAGSKHIDISLKVKPHNIYGYNRNDRLFDGHMIEGYSITNESGVTYHFGLPAYSFDEESYQERINQTGGLAGNRITRSRPYAYTWHLTTITGPDFVDRNNNQQADEGDWGYWIDFEYGKWSNSYVWRNPSEGFQRDEDNEFQNVSMGKKEIYYLNAIRTRTHIALFEKNGRYDGKGESPAIFGKNVVNGIQTNYSNPGTFDINSSQSLQLERIYVLNVEDAWNITPNMGNNNAFEPAPNLSRNFPGADFELAENIFDHTDVDAYRRILLELKSVRIIDFNYDYSLCSKTNNSIDINTMPGNPGATKWGKLTLNSVLFRGKRGTQYAPPIKFEYEVAAEDVKSATGSLTQTSFSTTNAVFQVGDLLAIDDFGSSFVGVITSASTNNGVTTYQLANNPHSWSQSPITLKTTKNPPYNKDAYDLWGMYKSDYGTEPSLTNENLRRMTTVPSSKSADAWSLRKITSTLGSQIKITYEPDMYKTVLNDNGSFIVNVQGTNGTASGSMVKIIFLENDWNYIVDNFKLGDKVNFISLWEGVWSSDNIYETRDSRTLFPSVNITAFNPGERSITTNVSYPTLISIGSETQAVFKTANFLMGKGFYKPAGTLRVKKVTTKANNVETSTVYGYKQNGSTNESGVSSYEPNVMDQSNITWTGIDEAERKAYKRALFKDIQSLLAISREVPPPGVMYEYATVTTETKQPDEPSARSLEGKTEYQFEVFRANMVDRQVVGTQQGSNSLGTYYVRNLALKKFVTGIGNIKRVTQYNNDNGQKLSETINHYLHDGLENLPFDQFMDQYRNRLAQFSYQGYLQERYSEVKEVSNQPESSNNGVKSTFSAREEFPCISTGQTIINYINGTRTKSESLAYDFYSGALTKSVETDAYGNRFMTEVIPAYRKYPALGLKLNDASRKNMLTQKAGTYAYKVDANNNVLGLVSANVTTWSNDITAIYDPTFSVVQNGGSNGWVWRVQSNYSWLPATRTADGLTTMGNFSDFNWTTPASSHANWKKTSEITLYDVFSKALEVKDINGNYAATHIMNVSQKVQLTGSPAGYYEIAYCGAEEKEDIFDGIVMDEAYWIIDAAKAHTGTKCFGVYGSQPAISYTVNTNKLVAGRDYLVSVWIKPETGTASDLKLYYQVNGVEKATASSAASNKTANGWTLVNLVVKGSDIAPGNTLRVGCRNDHSVYTYVDDMLFRPLNGTATAYVYDPFSGELTYLIDANNLYTKFEYDAGGRLVKTFREKINAGIIKTAEYAYNYSATKYLSDPIDGSFQKNDCPSNMAGTWVPITLPGGAFVSYFNPMDANAQAEAYAQSEANRLGSCTAPTTVYVRYEMGDFTSETNGCIYIERRPVYLRFYSDPGGTVPLVVNNLVVNMSYYYSEQNPPLSPVSITCNGTETLIDPDLMTMYDDPCDQTLIIEEYWIENGTGYTIL